MNRIMRFIKDEKGLEMVEYAVIGALITLAAVAIIGTLGGSIAARFTSLNDAVN